MGYDCRLLVTRGLPPVKRIVLVLFLSLAPGLAGAATTRYATDQMEIPVRTGKSTGHKILRMVKSGTPLPVLQEDDDGYSLVDLGDGRSGWVLSRFLMDDPVARDRLANAEARVAALEEENRRLEEELEAFDATRASLERCGTELDEIRQTAARSIEIEEENRRLQQEVVEARDLLRATELENASLRDESSRDWFVAGASVALGSLVLGLIIPRIPWRKRRRWDQF